MNAGPTAGQLEHLWSFARGDADPLKFEEWFLGEQSLEASLGSELHWDLTASSYQERDAVWKLRQRLLGALAPFKTCECPTLRDLDNVAMGGEVDADDKFRSDHVFETIDEILSYGPPKWWLDIRCCRQCETNWLVAQEERIYDEWFLQRIQPSTVEEAKAGKWPVRFSSYEDVLAVARDLSSAFTFFDSNAACLLWTVEDLLGDRTDITAAEVGSLVGISADHADRLIRRVSLRLGTS